MTKHRYFLIITLVFTMIVTSCSGSDTQPQTENTTVETTQDTVSSSVSFGTQPTEWERELTESEKQALLDEMPEIVFVMSEHYDNNILGFYITSTGDVNMYDFRNAYPGVVYDIPEVYDRLTDVCCDKIEPSPLSVDWERNYVLYEENLPDVSAFELKKWYYELKNIAYKLERVSTIPVDSQADYRYYGVRQGNGDKEFILLGAGGKDYVYLDKESSKDIEKLCGEIMEVFPALPTYY